VEEEPKRKEEEFLQKGGKKTNTPEDNGLSTRHSHTTFILAPTLCSLEAQNRPIGGAWRNRKFPQTRWDIHSALGSQYNSTDYN
jgi:hypothetical protein